MTLTRLKKLSSSVISRNSWWTYIVDKYTFPSGKEGEYHYVHTSGSSFIIPVLEDGRIIMVNQYRYLNDRESIEFPGGGIKEGQNPKRVARKELIEETGYDGELERIGFFNPYNGVTDEICHVFIARNLKPSAKETKDESEEFEVITLTKDEIEEKIKTNEIYDGMTLASWSLVKHHL